MKPHAAPDIGVYRNLVTRVMVLLCLFFMAWRGLSGGLVNQLQQPPLFRAGYDFSYWALHLSGLDRILLRPAGSLSLVFLLFASGVSLLIRPSWRLAAVVFAGSYLLHCLVFNLYICMTPHVQAGFAILLWSCCAATPERFSQWWRAMRYYVCYIFVAAFLWKLHYGSFFQWAGGSLFVKEYAAAYLYYYPSSFLAQLSRFLLAHPLLLNLGEKLVFAAQGLFLLGFFTTRYDRLLLVVLLLFMLTIIFAGHHFFAEFSVLLLPLLRTADWERLSVKIRPGRTGNPNQNLKTV